jgi:hypothetical protein
MTALWMFVLSAPFFGIGYAILEARIANARHRRMVYRIIEKSPLKDNPHD